MSKSKSKKMHVLRTHANPEKGLAVRYQGCCGLACCMYLVGIRKFTRTKLEKFRKFCRENSLVSKRGEQWTGETMETERMKILKFLNVTVKRIPVQSLKLNYNTLGEFICKRDIFESSNTYLVTVTEHCLLIKANGKRESLFGIDQREIRMTYGCEELKRDWKLELESIWIVKNKV